MSVGDLTDHGLCLSAIQIPPISLILPPFPLASAMRGRRGKRSQWGGRRPLVPKWMRLFSDQSIGLPSGPSLFKTPLKLSNKEPGLAGKAAGTGVAQTIYCWVLSRHIYKGLFCFLWACLIAFKAVMIFFGKWQRHVYKTCFTLVWVLPYSSSSSPIVL